LEALLGKGPATSGRGPYLTKEGKFAKAAPIAVFCYCAGRRYFKYAKKLQVNVNVSQLKNFRIAVLMIFIRRKRGSPGGCMAF
jgi:hypothetical protein